MENVKIHEDGWWESEEDIPHLLGRNICDWIIDFLKNDKNHLLHDFGCGLGHYLQEFSAAGFTNLVGYEGKKAKNSVFPNIIEQNIAHIFDVPQKGNVICLEVGEHIPAEFEDNLLTNLANACDKYLVLTWAARGQTWDGHVNMLNNDEVVPKVVAKGFEFLPKETKLAKDAVKDWGHLATVMIYKKNSIVE